MTGTPPHTPAARHLIREGKRHPMPTLRQAGATSGLCPLDRALQRLVRRRRITLEDAQRDCSTREAFHQTGY